MLLFSFYAELLVYGFCLCGWNRSLTCRNNFNLLWALPTHLPMSVLLNKKSCWIKIISASFFGSALPCYLPGSFFRKQNE